MKDWHLSPRSEAKQGWQSLLLLLKSVLAVIASAVRWKKEIKAIKIGKEEIKLSLSTDDRIMYTENP